MIRRLHNSCALDIGSVGSSCVRVQVVNNLKDAHEKIDSAISTAPKENKPVYITISCSFPGIPHSTFDREPMPFFFPPIFRNTLAI
nr:pyruvate decarboxylase 1 [Tanacetum cinerariifolium]